jgi:hypothetical protein
MDEEEQKALPEPRSRDEGAACRGNQKEEQTRPGSDSE